jgi:uncharacterized protein (DUF488 family)
MKIYTIGHSILSKEMFIEMLQNTGVGLLADVRAFPASRKHPQFAKEKMMAYLPDAGIDYMYFTLLGGRRGQSGCVGETLNDGWKNQSFHNYADYTLTPDFQEGLTQLKETAEKKIAAICCAERHPARCHRLLISNWLEANGWDVNHIINGNKGETKIIPHQLGKWGAMPIVEEDGTVIYPKLEFNQPK